ncbi:Aldehyde Dehydrogenase [Halogeometricum pallidum JCM 14848]|uniref:Aldehyde Dehydrogenase n=1 Tax=Halogeometricum pallidum JCM 14848 TaxID=1227487 RepID=M0CZG6_HALPD|nr:aldehyde dehydrogenase family protein [Halogeometricum pallidum]ELZ27832.1 Aldehyde Dehydrogenase [Halogeometricum pallidum JCM 14848]
MPPASGIYVDGEWVESSTGETTGVEDPATGETVGEIHVASASDAERAIEAAVGAQAEWAATPGPERGAILRRTGELLAERKDGVAETLTREEGKTLAEASGEVQRAVDIFHYYGEKAREIGGTVKAASSSEKRLRTEKEPLGTVSLITPWNYPIAIPAWKLAPALATGNTAVLKPATVAPGPSRAIVECLAEAGLPAGVANYVTGSGSELGPVLTEHEDVDGVSFTGSTVVGTGVYQSAAADMKRVQCEMGGKNPTVVAPSADFEAAVEAVGAGAFGVTGQACTACSRAVVHEDVYDEFVSAVADYAESLTVGSGLDDVDMGPHVTADELESTLEYVDIARDEGATLVTGGGRPSDDDAAAGHFVEPTVFADVESDMRIAREEVFGPVLAVIEVSDLDEAIAVANDVEFGLSASIFTQDLSETHAFTDRVEAGVAKVNEKTTGLELHVPFGGYKGSSTNTYREQGDAAIDFFTSTKTVYLNY